MLRVSEETRERVQQLAREEFGGASADEAIKRLLDEHWELSAIAAVRSTREHEPAEWSDYLAEAEEGAAAEAPVVDGWDPEFVDPGFTFERVADDRDRS